MRMIHQLLHRPRLSFPRSRSLLLLLLLLRDNWLVTRGASSFLLSSSSFPSLSAQRQRWHSNNLKLSRYYDTRTRVYQSTRRLGSSGDPTDISRRNDSNKKVVSSSNQRRLGRLRSSKPDSFSSSSPGSQNWFQLSFEPKRPDPPPPPEKSNWFQERFGSKQQPPPAPEPEKNWFQERFGSSSRREEKKSGGDDKNSSGGDGMGWFRGRQQNTGSSDQNKGRRTRQKQTSAKSPQPRKTTQARQERREKIRQEKEESRTIEKSKQRDAKKKQADSGGTASNSIQTNDGRSRLQNFWNRTSSMFGDNSTTSTPRPPVSGGSRRGTPLSVVQKLFQGDEEEWVTVFPKTRIFPGEMVPVTVNGIDLLVIASNDGKNRLYCIANSCPHLGTPLETGQLVRLPAAAAASAATATSSSKQTTTSRSKSTGGSSAGAAGTASKDASKWTESEVSSILQQDGCEDCIVCPLHKTAFALESGDVRGEWCPYPPVVGKVVGLVKEATPVATFSVRTKGKFVQVRINSPIFEDAGASRGSANSGSTSPAPTGGKSSGSSASYGKSDKT